MYGIVRLLIPSALTNAARAIEAATTVGAHNGNRRRRANGSVQPSAMTAMSARFDTFRARKTSTTDARANVRTSASTARARIRSKTACMRGRYRRNTGRASSLQATAKSSSRTTRDRAAGRCRAPACGRRCRAQTRRCKSGKRGTRMSAVLPKENATVELTDARVLHDRHEAIVAARNVARRYGVGDTAVDALRGVSL